MFRRVYLDNSATTPIDPEVLESMLPYFTNNFGNPSSIHFFGQEARSALDKARHQVSALINARPNEITFTSGGTEANNLAIRGLLEANKKYGNKVITSAIEHPSVKSLCETLEKNGYEVSCLPVYEDGIVKIEDVKNAITENTVLISIMTANNEIGTLQPVEEIGQLVKDLRASGKKIWFHTDAVQAVGKIEVDVNKIGCDLLAISAHKIYAPKGIGALYVGKGVRLQSQNIGGHQERERRGGTESVPLVVGFGKASELALSRLLEQTTHLWELRNRFEKGVSDTIPNVVFNGNRIKRLPNISNVSFRQVEGEGLLINLDLQGIAVSTGSACSSGSLELSPIIRALGCNDEIARGAIRFSFGKDNQRQDVDYLMGVLPKAVENLRKLL
ncbi:MAG: cysteine desulfurase family protein [Acidobacteriota bacterium]